METGGNKKNNLREAPSDMLTAVIAKLKGKVLFPEKVEKAKQYLKKAKMKTV